MLVGEGRAGKSALANSILGRPYENLDSTIGINEFTCSIGYAGVNFSGNGNYNQSWKELKDQKKTKDLETAVASMIHQQKTKRSSTVVNDTALDKEESLLKGGYIEGEDHSLQEGDLAMPQGTALHAVRSLTPKMEKQNDELAEKVRENLPTFSAATTTKRNEVPEVQVRDVEKKEDPFSTEFDSSLVMKYLGEQSQLESKFVISVFDFGGQSVFNVIHPFFLTQSGVYLITFNMEWLSSNAKPSIREECIRYMSFWLNSVIIHTQNQAGKVAPVAFVGTRKDIIHSPDEHLSISTLIYETFQSSVAWPHIIENPGAEGPSGKADLVFFPVNNVLGNQDPTIQHLLQYIERKIDNSDYVHVERPLSWFKVLDIFKGRNVPYLSYSEVEKIVVSCDIPKSKLPVLLKFYHEMGILMWHNEDMLRDIVVFDPIEYFVKPATIIICKHVPNKTDGIYHSLEIHKKVRKDFPEEFNEMTTHGIVSDKLLLALLEDYVANVKYIKQLMLKYGLLVPLLLNQSEDLEDIMEENTTLEVEGQWYLAPALLPEKELNLDTLRFDRTKASNSFAFVFAPPKGLRRYATISYEESRKSGFLPNGLFERLIAKSVTWSMTTSNFISRNALYNCSKNYAELEFGNQRFEMIVDYEHHLINVRLLYGNNPLVLHDRLKEQISEIISECLKSLTFLSVLKYSLPETSDRKEELNHNNENNVLLVRLKHIQSVVKKRSTLQIRRKEFYQLLTAPEAMELYEPWLNEFITFPDYDVFLSYRWGIDSQVVKGLYDRISYQTVDRTSRTIRTFLDKIRLQEGANFQSNIISSLSKSLLFVPVVSTDALQRLIHLKSTDEDNLLLEWICALELLRVGHQHSSSRVMKVLPLFFGSRVNEMILDLFQEGIINQLPELIPDKCLETAEKLLAQIGLCLSVERKQSTVKEIVSEITKFLFLKACDSKDLIHFIKFATEKLVAHLDDSLLSLPPPSSGNAHEMLVAVPTGMEQGPTPGPRPVPVPSVTVPQTPVHPPGSQQAPHQANDNPPNYDEAWEFIKPENRSKSCIEDEDQHSLLLLVRLIDKEMGVESAKDLIELSQEDLLKIAVLLKKIPQTKFKRALQLI